MSELPYDEQRQRIEAFQRTNRLGLATLFFSDLVGSTQLKQNLGDRDAVQLLHAHHAAFRELLATFPNAEEISTAGDSFFLVFPAPSDAVRFALLAQARTQALAAECGYPLRDRIGIHVGEVFIHAAEQAGKPKDFFGIHVDTGARIMSLGDGDQILLSRFAFDNARQAMRSDALGGSGELEWLNHGFYEIKGVGEPVEICEVGEVGRARLAAPPSGERGHRVVTGDGPVLGWRPAAGQTVPNTQWVLDRALGEGGFGEVWLARHQTLKDRRVFKFCFNAEKARSLKREVTLFRVLREHVGAKPGIVAIHDVFFDEPPYYIVMDHVDGPTLNEWAEAHMPLDAVPLETRLEIVAQVADALQTAHDAGVIHRDVKPPNILIAEENGAPRAMLTDFGIGQLVSGATPAGITDHGFTRTMIAEDSLTGTQLYLAPEMLAGQPASTRSDIYALGVVLYQFAVGALNRPLTSDWADDIADPLLRDDTHQCVAGDPAKRFVGAAQLAENLRALPQRREHMEREEQRRAKSARRRKQRLFATAATIVLLVAVVVLAIAFGRETKLKGEIAAQAQLAEENARIAKRNEKTAVESGEAARRSLAKSALNLAEASLREGNGLEMQAALNDVPEDLRDSTWRYLLERSDTSLRRVRIGDAYPASVAAHPRLPRVFAIRDDKKKITMLEVRSGVHLLQFAPGFPPGTKGGASRMAFSPDGERIAVGGWNNEAGIVIHSTRDGKKLLHWKAPFTNRLEFSPDGKLLLQTAHNDRSLSLWDAASGELVRTYAPGGSYVRGAFTSDGGQMLTFGESDGLRLVNTPDGKLIRRFAGVQGVISALAIGVKDGEQDTAVAADNNGFVTFYDLRDERPISRFRVHTTEINFMAFTPSGEEIITVAGLRDGCQAISIWQPRTSERIRTLMGGSGSVFDLGVHPLSRELLVAGPNGRVWDLVGTPPRWRFYKSVIPSGIAFWGSDDLLFSPVQELSVTLQNLAGRVPSVVWKPANKLYSRPSVSADGRIAAISSSNSPASCILLRHPGPQAEQSGSFEFSKAVSSDGPVSLRLSPTGDRVLAVGRKNLQIELYDTGTGQQTVAIDNKGCVRFNDLGWLSAKRVVGLVTATRFRGESGSEEWIVLWDAATGQRLHTAKNRTAMDVLAVAPDGRQFAEAGADKRVRIRDAETLAVQQEFRAHDDRITALAWHPTKPILATASADLSIRLWNLETGRQLDEFRGPLTAPFSLAFSPSGQRLACATVYSPTLVWEPESLK